jgi:MFS family permease
MQEFFQALSNRNFLLLWLSELFSQIAMNMMNFILLLVAFQLTRSNTAVSAVVLAFTVPAIVFGILAGVYVDRWNKKYVLIVTNVLRMFLVGLLAFLHSNLLAVYLVTFIVSIVTQFFIPAETPLIPQLVSRDQLLSANALFSMAWFGSVFIAYSMSGPILIFLGEKNALLLLSLTYLCAAIFAYLLKDPYEKTRGKALFARVKVSFFNEIQVALKTIIQTRNVAHAFFLLTLSQIFTLIIAIVGPGYGTEVLHIKVNEFPIYFVVPAVVGMATGAVIITRYFKRFSRHKIATLGLFLGGGAIFFLPQHAHVQKHSFIAFINTHLFATNPFDTIHILVVLAWILGMANAFMFVPSNTLVQEHTPESQRGKVYGALSTVVSLASLLPVIAVGSLADIFGVRLVLVAISVILLLIGISRITL